MTALLIIKLYFTLSAALLKMAVDRAVPVPDPDERYK